MNFEPQGSLTVRCELTAETNGVVTSLTGSRSTLRWDIVDARAVLADKPADRDSLRNAASTLAGLGLTVEIVESDRRLLDVGDTRSRLGSLLLRTPHVRPRALWRLFRLNRALGRGLR